MPPLVLLVDDEPNNLRVLSDTRRHEFDVAVVLSRVKSHLSTQLMMDRLLETSTYLDRQLSNAEVGYPSKPESLDLHALLLDAVFRNAAEGIVITDREGRWKR